MSEAELKLVTDAKNCTIYTIQFLSDNKSKLRLYCLRLSDKILILGNGGVKKTRTYGEDDTLKGYVITLQKFDRLMKDGVKNGSISVIENIIETDNTFDL